MDMVTKETVELFVELLYGWQNFFLREDQRALFFVWLRAHTKTAIELNTFKENLCAWLLDITDPEKLCGEILIIHSEILWFSKHEVEYEI